ncbi:MAG: MBL fold metallo-hydrolase, partial [Clostridia bacterium]|nr:MBL fold metallo-hydrolase [Clostridia bacterium]
MVFNVTDDIKYIGVDDTDIDLFEGQYKVPNGVSYNSYVCTDEKIAVFDTVDKRKTEEWLKNLAASLNGRKPDYLIVSHVEPDHSASIPAFLKAYPCVTVVGNEKTFLLIERFYGNIVKNKLTVKDGEELNLGKHEIAFAFAPMVHWPEVMTSFDKTDGVLFSADAFGKFGALYLYLI